MFDSRRELLDVHRETPAILRLMLRDIGDASARQPPPEGGWSVVEVVAHLADIEEVTRERVERILGEDIPQLIGIDQEKLAEEGNYPEKQLASVLERFEDQRAAQIQRLEWLDESGWQRLGRHNEFGDITVESLITIMAAHDAVHLAQVAHVLTAQGRRE